MSDRLSPPLVFGPGNEDLVKKFWPNEAGDFTPWVADNLAALAEAALLPPCEPRGTEVPVGPYRADVVGEYVDGDEDRVLVVENQITAGDHRHLGQLLAYAVHLDASAAIWVAPSFRPEHLAVVDALNAAVPPGRFPALYAVAVAVVEAGAAAVPVLRRVAGPVAGAFPPPRRDLPPPALQAAVAKLHAEKLWGKPHAPAADFAWSKAGPGGVKWSLCVYKAKVRAEIYFSATDAAFNEAAFEALDARRADFDQQWFAGKVLGDAPPPLNWEPLPAKVAARISATLQVGGDSPHAADFLVDAMRNLRRVFEADVADTPGSTVRVVWDRRQVAGHPADGG